MRALASLAASVQPEDKWIAANIVPLIDNDFATGVKPLRDSCSPTLNTLRMPSTRNEEYRFTDLSTLLKSKLLGAPRPDEIDNALVEDLVFPEAAASTLVVVNGQFRRDLSRLEAIPDGMFVGCISEAPAKAQQALGAQSNSRGGPFAVLNGATIRDALCICAEEGVVMDKPLYLLYLSTGSEDDTSRVLHAPRLLVHAAAGAVLEVIEEYVALGSNSAGAGEGQYFTCAVAEVDLEEDASVQHGYIQREAAQAVHVKSTLVKQAKNSQYQLTEVSLGGGLARHDVGVEQVGPETSTRMHHFLLCGSNQLHDLHTKLVLDHPHGQADQLHKCIVSHATGRGVFDGNVKVNRFAQKTDAGQLSRNLLLVPRATVNVKPNLQIVADDVKCTHGCAISDLSQEEMFYFQARGIDKELARQALVYSFGAEVVQSLKYDKLTSRIQQDATRALQQLEVIV